VRGNQQDRSVFGWSRIKSVISVTSASAESADGCKAAYQVAVQQCV